ncbi:MAG: uroporphyrinogen decarboxylase family protein [Verrucomicrobiae bacterium]
MSPRDRVLATLNRTPADRVPVDMWCTGEVLDSLRAHTGETDELAVYQKLGLDKIVWVFPGYGGHKYFDPNESGEVNLWGVPTRLVKAGAATYHEFGKPPLGACESPDEITSYPGWPAPELFEYAAAKASAQSARDFGFATIGPWISHFEIYCTMRGLENALMDVIAEPEILQAGLDQIDRVQTAMLLRLLDELGDLLDIVFISDDLGTQESQLMSVDAWSEHIQPRMKRWCDIIHEHGKKVLFHTDGAARPFIPGLIEAGIDILNPIQHVCPGMDRASLKAEFGGSVIFHGGVENQKVLPFGSPEEVRRETRECLDTLGAGREGYICSSCHNIQAGTPVANVLAYIDEALKG